VLKTVEGIYKDGKVVLLERPEDLSEARVIVTFLPGTDAAKTGEQARQRMLARMRTGIPLGGAPYPTREEIYGFAF
jgi:hypothetical protein